MGILFVRLIVHQAGQFEYAEHILRIVAGRAIAAQSDVYALVPGLDQWETPTAQAQIADGIMHHRRVGLRQSFQVAILQPDGVGQGRTWFQYAELAEIADPSLPEHLMNHCCLQLGLDCMQMEPDLVAFSQVEAGYEQFFTAPVDAAGTCETAYTPFGCIVPCAEKMLQRVQLLINRGPGRKAVDKGMVRKDHAALVPGLDDQVPVLNRRRNGCSYASIAIGAHRCMQ